MHVESISSEGLSRKEIYEALLPQIEFLYEQESDQTAILANIIAILKTTTLPFFWLGFYRVQNDQLILGPFQGSPAVFRIEAGQGVCGVAWKRNETQIVPDVEQFPGHIPCNCNSRSEIVVPVRRNGIVVAVIDADSDRLDAYDETDACYLEQIAGVIGKHWI
jgi:GAF domain-containing protein